MNEINKKRQREIDRQILRLLKLLSKNRANGLNTLKTEKGIKICFSDIEHSFTNELVSHALEERLIVTRGEKTAITEAGFWHLNKALNPDMAISLTKGMPVKTTINREGEYIAVTKNLNESPLCRLYTRKTNSGSAYISSEEFEAGERLRSDFERGQLQPKITASLSGAVGSSGSSLLGGANDITDFALDARLRVNKAIQALGPELSGIVLDVCCFLKGLETVERERRWPPRSAKLMLKTALSSLARHYGISGYSNTARGRTTVWNSPDNRPVIHP